MQVNDDDRNDDADDNDDIYAVINREILTFRSPLIQFYLVFLCLFSLYTLIVIGNQRYFGYFRSRFRSRK